MKSGVFEMDDEEYERFVLIYEKLKSGRNNNISAGIASINICPEMDSIEKFAGYIINQKIEKFIESVTNLCELDELLPGIKDKVIIEARNQMRKCKEEEQTNKKHK